MLLSRLAGIIQQIPVIKDGGIFFLSFHERREQPGGNQALLPGSKQQEKKKQSEVTPGKVWVGYLEFFFHWEGGHTLNRLSWAVLEPPSMEGFKDTDMTAEDMV